MMVRRDVVFALAGLFAWRPASAIVEEEVSALDEAARAGRRSAIRHLFALRLRADGAVAEDIDIVLGSTVPAHAQVFLEELKYSGQQRHLDGLLGNLGESLTDDFAGQLRELERRKFALEAVHAPALSEIRRLCVTSLDDMIRRLHSEAKP